MELNKEILQEFKKITGQDIQQFFSSCVVFFSTSYNKIVAYYSGTITIIDKGAFNQFDNLQRNCEGFFLAFEQMQNRLGNLKWWEVLEQLEDIDLRLKTLRKINKWTRSSLTNVAYDPSIQAIYTLKPKQTLERIAQDVLAKIDPQNDWEDIALSNNLTEEEYTSSGGVDLQLKFPRINKGVRINSVVDVMLGKSIYGKDIDKQIHFDTDDIAVLDYDSTVQQSVYILAGLKKNDNPEFPFDGLQREIIIGGTRAALNFPIIDRQMQETFGTDDSLKDFQITNIAVDGVALNLEFEVSTRLNETTTGDIAI